MVFDKLNKVAHKQMINYQEKKGLKGKEMAEKIGIRKNYYSRLKNNPEDMNLDFVKKLEEEEIFKPVIKMKK